MGAYIVRAGTVTFPNEQVHGTGPSYSLNVVAGALTRLPLAATAPTPDVLQRPPAVGAPRQVANAPTYPVVQGASDQGARIVASMLFGGAIPATTVDASNGTATGIGGDASLVLGLALASGTSTGAGGTDSVSVALIGAGGTASSSTGNSGLTALLSSAGGTSTGSGGTDAPSFTYLLSGGSATGSGGSASGSGSGTSASGGSATGSGGTDAPTFVYSLAAGSATGSGGVATFVTVAVEIPNVVMALAVV